MMNLGVVVPNPEHQYLIDDSTHEALSGLGHGVLIGMPLGAIAGIALAAIAAPGVGVIGVGGVLLFGGHLGALWGAVAGAYLGLTGRVRHLQDMEEHYNIPLAPKEILLVVIAGTERIDVVCQIMQRHGARRVRETVVA